MKRFRHLLEVTPVCKMSSATPGLPVCACWWTTNCHPLAGQRWGHGFSPSPDCWLLWPTKHRPARTRATLPCTPLVDRLLVPLSSVWCKCNFVTSLKLFGLGSPAMPRPLLPLTPKPLPVLVGWRRGVKQRKKIEVNWFFMFNAQSKKKRRVWGVERGKRWIN